MTYLFPNTDARFRQRQRAQQISNHYPQGVKTMKVSARNLIPGTVKSVSIGKAMVKASSVMVVTD